MDGPQSSRWSCGFNIGIALGTLHRSKRHIFFVFWMITDNCFPRKISPSGFPLVEEPLSLTGAIDPHYFRWEKILRRWRYHGLYWYSCCCYWYSYHLWWYNRHWYFDIDIWYQYIDIYHNWLPRDPLSGHHFLLWRTDNMWSSDPEDRAIVYIRLRKLSRLLFVHIFQKPRKNLNCKLSRNQETCWQRLRLCTGCEHFKNPSNIN